VFEQKEYIESYVLEHYIHQMIAQDEALRKEYEQKKESDPEWAENPQQIRRWFYRRTPFWDTRIGVYPVGRIDNRDFLAHLPLE
jgi:hypothetical protein